MNKLYLFVVVFFLCFSTVFSQEKPYTKYFVKDGETIQSISQKLSITPYDLLKLNPDLKDGIRGIKVLIIPNKDYKPTNSQEHVDYVEGGFLYHKVLPKENFFRLKQEYGAAKRILRKYNPILRRENLKAGQIIKIPVASDFKLPETNVEIISQNTKPYLVKPKETKYSIARRYGIDVIRLVELNPQLKDEVLKIGEIIKVPNLEEIPNESDEYVVHQIEKGDTFFNLGQRFAVSEEDLLTLNPVLADGLKEGLLIKIPTIDIGVEKVFTPYITPGKQINAVLLLPFLSNRYVNFDKNRTSDIVTDFYMGALVALDSLKEQGLSVNIKVFDTQNSKDRLRSIFSALDLNSVDVIIGPMVYSNVEYVSNLLRGKNIPLISPVSQNDHSELPLSTIVQEVPTRKELSQRVLSHIKSKYHQENLIVISDEATNDASFVNTLISDLEAIDSLNKVELIKPEEGYIKRDLFLDKLVEKRDNWVILASQDTVVTRDVINNLGSLPGEINTTLFALYKGGNFNVHEDVNNNLAHINFHYPTHNFIDYENENVKKFMEKYRSVNYVDPSEYAFKGFDLVYDTLLRFGSYDDIDAALNAGTSTRTSTKYKYHKNGLDKGFINNGIFLVKYDGLNLVEVVDE